MTLVRPEALVRVSAASSWGADPGAAGSVYGSWRTMSQ